jgi:hypothetical protein
MSTRRELEDVERQPVRILDAVRRLVVLAMSAAVAVGMRAVVGGAPILLERGREVAGRI